MSKPRTDELATMALNAEELEALMRKRLEMNQLPEVSNNFLDRYRLDWPTFCLAVIGAIAVGVFALFPLAKVSWTYWVGA